MSGDIDSSGKNFSFDEKSADLVKRENEIHSQFNPLYKVENAFRSGHLPPKIHKLVNKRFEIVTEGIKRVEDASGLKYPHFYVEPSLVISTSAAEYTQFGIFFARTIPVVGENNYLNVVIQVTAPLVTYGLKGTIHAILAHEFMHYLELVSRILKMNVVSDELSGTLFEGTYADSERLLEPRAVFRSDPTLIKHITSRFPEGFRDLKLEDKVIKDWMNKGYDTIRVPIDANTVKIPVEVMTRLQVDQTVKDRIVEYENVRIRRRRSSDNTGRFSSYV